MGVGSRDSKDVKNEKVKNLHLYLFLSNTKAVLKTFLLPPPQKCLVAMESCFLEDPKLLDRSATGTKLMLFKLWKRVVSNNQDHTYLCLQQNK